MTVYFYHTQNLNYIKSEWEKGRFPSHLLYGAMQLPQHGIDVVMHEFTRYDKSRLWRSIDVARKILLCKSKFDAIYATKQNGLDIIILLRALGLFRKPILLWVHQPILAKHSALKQKIAKIYFKGTDQIFMFSEHIIKATINSGIVPESKLKACPWGVDLDFYDNLIKRNPVLAHSGFISTGKELRDMPTLCNAFHGAASKLDIITAPSCGFSNYENFFNESQHSDNITILINRTMWIPELAGKVWPHACVCICCLESNYTVGLTTLVEALAFGLPVIASANPNFPFNIEKEGCGISVGYGDVEGWRKAVEYISSHPEEAAEMGKKGRNLAESIYNIKNCASTVAVCISTFSRNRTNS